MEARYLVSFGSPFLPESRNPGESRLFNGSMCPKRALTWNFVRGTLGVDPGWLRAFLHELGNAADFNPESTPVGLRCPPRSVLVFCGEPTCVGEPWKGSTTPRRDLMSVGPTVTGP